MPYIGNQPAQLGAYAVESFNGGGSSFTLSKSATTETVLLFIDGVRQTPVDAYSVSGTTLTTTATTPSGTNNVTVQFLGDVVDFGEPSDNSVTSTKIVDGTIVNADINASAAIALSKLASDPSNASNLSSGTVPTARLASGTANSTTFLRGDQTWASAGENNKPAFVVRMTGDQTLGDNVNTKATFNAEIIDTDGCYDPSTNYRFTPTTAGKYLLYAVYAFEQTNALGPCLLRLYKNGSQVQQLFNKGHPSYVPSGATLSFSSIQDANGTSDYFEVYIQADADNGGNVIGKAYGCEFGGFKVYES